MLDFDATFQALTGNPPFPWQRELYALFLKGGEAIPQACDLPTGLGKTSVIPIWLIALAQTRANGVPRRLVYVVNRRTVVDQATREAENLREKLEAVDKGASLDRLRNELENLCAVEKNPPLAISTLRGQFADNREWSTDPARPAIIVGTVDMIGSRLLFSGYGCGSKTRPLHAGFLGQDALLVHDEAHLEPAFQTLIETIEREQHQENGVPGIPGLRVMALTATSRGDNNPFKLTEEDRKHEIVRQRIGAAKKLVFHAIADEKKIADRIADLALHHKGTGNAILVFVRKVVDVEKIVSKLEKAKQQVEQLTGTLRGLERDNLVNTRLFQRFLPASSRNKDIDPTAGTAYLVCTSAGEVGVNISADDLVCDLSTFESMAQRFGRVNRFGDGEARIDIVHPIAFDEKHPLTPACEATLKLLKDLDGDASPAALGKQLGGLTDEVRQTAFSPPPTIVPATDILFDAWALTSIRGKMPGRPAVDTFLHGIAEWESPRTAIAWRNEVEYITNEMIEREGKDYLQELLADYPLKPHELLNDRTDRIYGVLKMLIAEPKAGVKGEKRVEELKRAKDNAAKSIWLIYDGNSIDTKHTLGELLSDEKKRVTQRLADSTILLPPSIGGLAGGMLDGTSRLADDVADIKDGPDQRIRIHPNDSDRNDKLFRAADMRRIRSIELPVGNDEEEDPLQWDWYEALPLEGVRTTKKPVTWQTHVDDVIKQAKQIASLLSLSSGFANALIIAAELHDHGKRRERFQTTLGNRRYPDVLLAKSGKRGARLPELFRHEFASVLDAHTDEPFAKLDEEMKDLVLHLIAAHHGRARPHFSRDETFDPERPTSEAEALAIETPRRFARLQRQYGRWGLAYLESLLRAADWAASANPSAYADETEDE